MGRRKKTKSPPLVSDILKTENCATCGRSFTRQGLHGHIKSHEKYSIREQSPPAELAFGNDVLNLDAPSQQSMKPSQISDSESMNEIDSSDESGEEEPVNSFVQPIPLKGNVCPISGYKGKPVIFDPSKKPPLEKGTLHSSIISENKLKKLKLN